MVMFPAGDELSVAPAEGDPLFAPEPKLLEPNVLVPEPKLLEFEPKVLVFEPKLLVFELEPLPAPVPMVEGESPGPDGLRPPVVTTFCPKNPSAGRACPN